MVTKENILQFFKEELIKDERNRNYEKQISQFSNSHSSEQEIEAFIQLMKDDPDFSYEAFFCLATIYRHKRDFSKLWKLINYAEQRKDFLSHVSLPHIKIMYETHSESLYDYDELLETAHQGACNLFDNAGYQHTFANAFATICEKCLPEDLAAIEKTWYDSALYCVNRAIYLEPDYAKFYCTKARIVSIRHHYEEANELILKAIDKENSDKSDYALLIGNYQYYRILIAMRKQQWLLDNELIHRSNSNKKAKEPKSNPASFKNLRPYVFVSYSHLDAHTVYNVLDDMGKNGINYWYDKDLETGNDWAEELGEKILNCEMVLVMLSNNAILSRNVRNEITMAQNHKKKILPIFIEEVELSPGAELQLQGYHWLLMYQMSTDMFRNRLIEDLSKVRQDNNSETTQLTMNPSVTKEIEKLGFKIMEQFCHSKTKNQDDCEDILVVTQDYIAVIDGATSKTRNRFEGKTGGKIAAELIADFITGGSLDASIDSKTAVYRIQAMLQEYARAHQLEEQQIHLCASAVIFSMAKKQIWAVGDCQFLLNRKHYTFYKKVDTILSDARALAIHMLLQSGYNEEELLNKDLARELILGELKMQQYLENKDDEYGYSVFSSQGMVKNISVTNVPPGSEVVLASDGYPELFCTLAESEARLNELIRLDPLCYKFYKSTKGLSRDNTHFDDRTYIRFHVE